MTWVDYALARRLLVEERVFAPDRARAREARAVEDAQAEAAVKHITRR